MILSYLALYRKFRPTTFDEVIGQDHISTTLRNQIMGNRISHAYLFCGSRGTGKTSLAKLFAKAVNCENPTNGNPCGKCPTCLAIGKADNMDVIEIDAASNNSVDDLRDLRDKVQFLPVSAKYKVYIIDEVHMLSINAFNALLKTLEEPPKHVIFILATTEVHKIPATILSRCMRFDFKLIPLQEIFLHLKNIYSNIGKEASDEALYAIAKAGDGSMRDALSIAEICLSLSTGKLTFDDVNEIVGNLSHDKLEKLFDSIISKDQKSTLTYVDEYFKSGKSISVVTRDIFQFFRDILILKVTGGDSLTLPNDVLSRMTELSKKADNTFLIRALDIFAELEPKYKLSQNPKILLETALLKLTNVQNDLSVISLARRVIALEQGTSQQFEISQKAVTAKAIISQSNENSQTRNANTSENAQATAENTSEVERETTDSSQLNASKPSNSVKKPIKQATNAKTSENSQATKLQQNDSSRVESQVSTETSASLPLDHSDVTPKNIAGLIIKQLRQMVRPALVSETGLSSVTFDDDVVTISVKTKSSFETFNDIDNKTVLTKIINNLGFSKLQIALNIIDDSMDKKIIENAKSLVGDLLKIQKN